MKSSQRRMSAGWSFTAGALSGAVAAFALLSSLHIPGLKAEVSDRPRLSAVESAGSAFSPQTPASGVADAHPMDSVVRPAPDSLRKAGPRSPASQRPSPRHSELDLQLD